MHICVISDSCFSGSLLEASKGKPATIDHEYFSRAYSRTSRQVLTAGALGPVPDRSEFAQLLRMSLEQNTSRYLDGRSVGDLGTGLLRDIPAGKHSLELRGEGMANAQRTRSHVWTV